MDANMNSKELMSALADGQARGDELARALEAACADRQALAAWQAYHLIGDVLRSGAQAGAATGPAFLDRVCARLAQEPLVPRELPAVAAPQPVRVAAPAANDGSFRWKVLAGAASVAAVGAVAWSVLGGVPGAAPAAPQLAAAPAPEQQPDATVLARSGAGLMLRDARLDELLAAHRQFGGASALAMPAGFLRNATFEGPAR